MEVVNTRLLGFNLTKDAENLSIQEISDMLNMRLRKTGELESRPGARRATPSAYIDNQTIGVDKILDDTKRLKYVQFVTASKEVINLFAIGNRVFQYDDSLNKFSLLYEAPGNSEVDIAAYLGYIMVTSHSSNLAIIRPLSRRVYLLNRGARIIKSEGLITGSVIDFITEDEIADTGLDDLSIDQASIYSSSIENVGAQVSSISPSGAEVSNLTWGSGNRYKTPVSLFLGASRRTGDDALTHDLKALTFSNQEFGTVLYSDFPNAVKTFTLNYKRRSSIASSDAGGNYCVTSGLVQSGSNFKGGQVRKLDGSLATFSTPTTTDWYAGHVGDARILFVKNFTVKKQKKVGDDWQDEVTIIDNKDVIYHQNSTRLYIWFANNQGFLDGSTYHEGAQYYLEMHSNFSSQLDTGEFSEGGFTKRLVFTPGREVLPDYIKLNGLISADRNYFNGNGVIAVAYKTAGGAYQYDAVLNQNTNPVGHRHYPSYSVTHSKQWVLKIDGGAEKIFTDAGSFTHITGSSDMESDVAFDDFTPNTPDPETILKIKELISPYDSSQYLIFDEQTGIMTARPLAPYYRIESILKGQSANVPIVSGLYPVYNLTGINYQNINISKQAIDTTFDVTYAHGETEIEYTLTPPGTALKRHKIRKYNKDNFDIREVMFTLHSESLTMARIAKLDAILALQVEAEGSYFLAIRRVIENIEIFSEYDVSLLGTPVEVKNIIDHNGDALAILLTTTGLHIFQIQNDIITLVSSYTGTHATEIKDFTSVVQANYTEVYCIRQGNPTTFVVRIIDGANGIEFETTDIETGLDHRVNFPGSATNFPSKIAFVLDDKEHRRIITDDTSDTPDDVNQYLEFKVNGAINGTTYDKIFSDQSFSTFEQIRPYNTPFHPTISVASGAYDRTGRFVYFFVAVEKKAGEVVFESYGSDISTIAQVTANTITLTLGTANAYPQITEGVVDVELKIYRLELRSSDQKVKSTDFIELETVALTETGSGTRVWSLTTPWVDHYESDSGAWDSIDGKEFYRGYTRFYPRCKFVATQGNAVVLLNDEKYQNNIYVSDLLDPTTWRPQNTVAAEIFTNNAITGAVPNNGLYVFTRDSYGILNGIGTNLSYQTLTKEVGIVDIRTAQVIDNTIWGLTERGLCQFQGQQYKKFDVNVERVTNEFVFNNAIVAFKDQFALEYRVIYDRNKVLSYSIPLNKWSLFQYPYDYILYGFNREDPLTDLPQNVLIARNDEPGVGPVYRFLVEDDKTVYDYVSGDGETVVTEKVKSYVTTKQFDMENPFAEKLWRRVHLNVLRSFGITGEVSINDGIFTPMIEQKKRTYFNDVPTVWYRFNELFGNYLTDYGKRGYVATVVGVTDRNQDGKIDRTIRFFEGSYANIGDVTPMPKGATISFWYKQENNGVTTPIIFSDNSQPSIQFLTANQRDYVPADFVEPMADFPAFNGAIESIIPDGGVADLALDSVVDGAGDTVVWSGYTGAAGGTIKSTGHGLVLPGPSHIQFKGNAALPVDRELVSVDSADSFTIDDISGIISTARWALPGDFNDIVVVRSSGGNLRVLSGLYRWDTTGAISDAATDIRPFKGQNIGGQAWWSDLVHVNPNAGSVSLQVPAGETWATFSNLGNGLQQMRLPNVGIGSMAISTMLSIG